MSENEIKPVVVDHTVAAHVASESYGERYGIDWIWHHDGIGLLHPQSAIDRLTAERDFARKEAQFLRSHRPIARRLHEVEAERDEAKRKLSVAAAEGKALIADAERYLLVQVSDAECLVRDAERYLDGGRSVGCRLAARRVRALLAARAEGGV